MSVESFKFKSISKTASDDNEIEISLQKIVNTLASVLERCLTPRRYSKIETLFEKSGSLLDMLYNIETMAIKISENYSTSRKTSKPQAVVNSSAQDECYSNLEKMVQKYEAEIRDHIRMEQQLGIYTQGLEEEIDALKQAASGKSANEKALEQNTVLKAELEKLRCEKGDLEQQLKRNTRPEFVASNTSVLGKLNAKSTDKVG